MTGHLVGCLMALVGLGFVSVGAVWWLGGWGAAVSAAVWLLPAVLLIDFERLEQ